MPRVAQAAAAPQPRLVRAVQHHTPALEHLFEQMALRVAIARSYRLVKGRPIVTLRLVCDQESDTLLRDERCVTYAASETLIYLGFYARVDAPCRIRLDGYFGERLPSETQAVAA